MQLPQPTRWRRFSLRAMFIALGLLCVLFAWARAVVLDAKRQWQAAEALRPIALKVSYEYERQPL